MAAPPPPQPNPNSEPPAAPPAQPPVTDMTGIAFRDQIWLNQYHLDRNLIFDYFSLSPFYDPSCNNQHLRMNSIHPLDLSHLSKMTGIEYMLTEVIEGNLFVLRKQKRDSPEKVTPMMTYYCLDGSIYQAPQLCNIFAARIGRTLYYVSKAFSIAASKLEKIGHVATDGEGEDADNESAAEKEAIDFREVKRVEHIISSLQRKLPPAPPPPPLPEGYAPPHTTETEPGSEAQQGAEQQQQQQLPCVDPIIDQGPAKRMKFD